MFEAGDTQGTQNIREDTGNTDELPVVNVDPKDWFKKLERPPTLDLEWNECKTVEDKTTQNWLSDLSTVEKPLIKFDDLMSILIDFSAFVMNRLQISDLTQDILVGLGTCRSYVELNYNIEECYKALTDQLDWNNPEGESSGRTYTTSLTKTKAAKYDLKGIEDMVPNLWSPIKVAYDKHALLGTLHWGPKREKFYGYASKRVSKHDVYSTKRILAVTNVKVNVWYDYGHLEEIEVRRSDQKLLFNLEGDVIVHFATALRMFPRRVVIQKRVEDLQLAYKFSDGTLQSVRDTLHDMATNLRMGYNKSMLERRWSHLDKTQSHIMVKEIDSQLLERRLMRSMEKFIGGRHYGEDLRLL
ncbi:hypothetical protein Tco_0718461 [Tanacetum coccineum]|uniref:Uncharacterized protein n=1 Tax=Tanacetum coccineum TaxID=301880 RepID=A0ABQ5DCN1_9ASTR